MRDAVAILKARAKKVPALAKLADCLPTLTEEEIAAAPIKNSDRKLLRKARPTAIRRQRAQELVKMMPVHEVKEATYRVFVYNGPDTTYHSFEVPTGTVITYTEEWVRFDHYRLPLRSTIDHLLAQSTEREEMGLATLNRFISDSINARHGLSTDPAPITNDRLYITSAPFRATS